MIVIREDAGVCFFNVSVQPRASRNEIAGVREGACRIRLTAAPVDGRANKALVEMLASALGAPKSNIAIVRGETSRRKVVSVAGLKAARILELLHAQGTRA
ncbi:MAG: DUF167 domain-containing protein [Acidobacteria bacterium]|nr:DUF167 domain-containing protein [Acidobacteriota bacterium]